MLYHLLSTGCTDAKLKNEEVSFNAMLLTGVVIILLFLK